MPPCEACGANFHLHRPAEGAVEGLLAPSDRARITGRGLQALEARGVPLECPRREPDRTERLEEAQAELEAARASGDQQREFVARGNVQRLQGRIAQAHWPADHERGW